VLGRCAFDVFPFLKETGEDSFFYEALAGNTVIARNRVFVIPETGKHGFFEASYSPLRDELGKIIGGLATIRDTTSRMRAEQALAESEAMFRALAETNPLMVAIYQDDRHVFVNQAAEPLTGYTHAELMEMPVGELVHPENRQLVRERGLARQRGENVPTRYELRTIRKDGTVRWIDFSAAQIQYKGKPARIGMAIDITERKNSEVALRKSEERLELALSGADLALWDWNLTTNQIFVNEQWATILGYQISEIDADFEHWINAIHPDDVALVTRRLNDHLSGKASICDVEYQIRAKHGRWKWIHSRGKVVERDASGVPVRIAGTHRDITDRKRAENECAKLETEVQSGEKLKSLGLLAGGIAHDFNNLLMGVLGHAELARTTLPAGSPAAGHLSKIETAAERAAELCHQLLAYSGRGRFVVERLDLNRAVLETATLLETTIAAQISLKFELSDQGPAIDADSAQIRRVIMNLLTNAADAIGNSPGTVALRTGIVPRIDEDFGTIFSDEHTATGPFAFVDVADTGVGMNAETVSKMFDPFFTSKFTGRGLGLAAVLGIVRGHRGAIQVNSRLGDGSVIRVMFPASIKARSDAMLPARSMPLATKTGTILVVDDTEVVRTVAAEVLEQAGYRVITAADGHEGIQAFNSHRDEIIAVLLDMTMPNLDGDQTFRELKRLEIEVPVLLTSGYDEQETTGLFGADGPAGFLQKPFRPQILIRKLEEILQA
jgi:PAS domain S-box-containing protein